MNTSTLLKKSNIDAKESVVLITAEEALEYLLETIEEYCPHLKIDKMTKKDIATLLNSYGSCIIDFHPEAYHQERATLLRNFEILQKYGMTDDDYDALDFC